MYLYRLQIEWELKKYIYSGIGGGGGNKTQGERKM
jgi:hypothetical protein